MTYKQIKNLRPHDEVTIKNGDDYPFTVEILEIEIYGNDALMFVSITDVNGKKFDCYPYEIS